MSVARHGDHDRIENLASIWSKKRGRREDWATSFREEVCASGSLVPQRAGGHIIRHKKGPLAKPATLISERPTDLGTPGA